MRLGMFATGTGRQSGGTETYERCLLRALLDIDQDNEYHVYCLNRSAQHAFGIERANLVYHVLHPDIAWVNTLTALPLALLADNVNLMHAMTYAPVFSPKPFVFTMHCFSNFAHPELYPSRIRVPLNYLIVKGLKKSRMTLCVSQNVRDLVAEKFKIPADRLAVVYNGVSDAFRPIPEGEARESLRAKYEIDVPYVLFVGQLKARKNIIRLIEAFALVRREVQTELKLVLAGRRIWSSEGIDEAVERSGVRDCIVELGHLALEDLPILYSGALCFAFPTLWEGFGIPVIEAMACGTPVVTSNVSSLPEIADGCAVLVDPHSVEAIASGIHRVISDQALRHTLRRRGLERASLFTWTRAATETLRVYRAATSN